MSQSAPNQTTDNTKSKQISPSKQKMQPDIGITAAAIVVAFIHQIIIIDTKKLIKIVPNEIIKVITDFYKNQFILISRFMTQTTNTLNPYIDNFFYCSFNGSMDIDKSFTLHPDSNIDPQQSLETPYCHIPNILSLNTKILSQNKELLSKLKINADHQYDAVLAFTQPVTMSAINPTPCLLIFIVNGDKTEYHKFISERDMNKTDLHQYRKSMYCGEKHGVIVHHYWAKKLKQLKLENLSLTQMMFRDFCSLNEIDSDTTFGNIGYIKWKESMFSIQCTKDHCYSKYDKKKKKVVEYERKCDIYDLNGNKWKSVKAYKYKGFKGNDNFNCCICSDGYQNIYIYTIWGTLSRYDCNKNEWVTIYEDLSKNHCIKSDLYKIRQFDTSCKIWFYNGAIYRYFGMGWQEHVEGITCIDANMDANDNNNVNGWTNTKFTQKISKSMKEKSAHISVVALSE